MKNQTTYLILAATLVLCACSSVPVVSEKRDLPTQIVPLDFSQAERPANLNRGKLSTQEAVNFANWTFANGGSQADHQLSAGALAASLEAGNFLNEEERIRLAVMTMQHGMLAGDETAMQSGARHWEVAYANLSRITYEGEVETYLAASRLSGHSPIPGLGKRANVTVHQLINR